MATVHGPGDQVETAGAEEAAGSVLPGGAPAARPFPEDGVSVLSPSRSEHPLVFAFGMHVPRRVPKSMR